MNKSKEPALRFEGFSEPWQEKTLGEIAETITGGGTPDTTIETYWNGDIPWIQSSDILIDEFRKIKVKRFVSDSAIKHSATKIILKNSIAIVTRIGVGKIAYVPFDYTTSQDFFSLSNLTINTWFCIYSLSRILKSTTQMTQGTSIKGITKNELLTIPILIPSLAEQEKIAGVLSAADELISLQSQKITALKRHKQALMQQLFPANGATSPTLRFEGFGEPWQEKTLGEIAEITMGQSPLSVNYTKNPKDHILVQGNADMCDGQVVPRVWTTQVTKTADIGDIIFSVRAPVGDVGKTAYKIVIGRGVAGIKGNDFIYQYLLKLKINSHWKTYSSGSTFESINSSVLKTMPILVPSLAEQEKIAGVLSAADNLISLHEQKLTALKRHKQALMQQLFPA